MTKRRKRKDFVLGSSKYRHVPISKALIKQLKAIQTKLNKKHKRKIPFVWITHNVEVRFKKK